MLPLPVPHTRDRRRARVTALIPSVPRQQKARGTEAWRREVAKLWRVEVFLGAPLGAGLLGDHLSPCHFPKISLAQ